MKRRITALLTILCMVLTMMPLHVHATEAGHVHYGGTATCKWKATCEGCGSIYGETDPNNHNDYFGEDNGDGRTHTAMCTCGHVYNASEAHDFSGWEEDGPGQEARFCYECYYTETRSTHTHNYSAATCTAPATCSCGETTGDVSSTNHVGGTEVRNAVAAGEFEPGYTGDTYCLGCGNVISYGETIPATHTHVLEWTYDSGMHWQKCGCGESSTAAQAHQFDDDADTLCDTCGYTREVHQHNFSTATCTTPATCSCGETTGDVDKSNHVGGTEVRDAKDASEFEAGYTGDTYCLGCGDKLADGQTIPATHQHSYTAIVTAPTCSEQGYTTYTCSCNDSYVSDYVDALGHDWSNYISNGDGSHTRTCTINNSHYQTATCGGGTATCKELATCSDCGAPYGRLNSTNHTGGTELRNAKDATETEDGYTGDTYCLGCNVKIETGSTIPATGSGDDDDDTHTHYYSLYNYDSTNHWSVCVCGQGQAGSVKAHTLVNNQNNNGHWKECSACNYYSDLQAHVYSNDSDETCNDCGYNRHVHSYSTATCTAPATCSCRLTKGRKNPNNHTGGTEIRNAVEATIVADGYTGDTYCKGCGAKLSSGEVIPKTGLIFTGTDGEIVTFTPGEGLVLPEDAVLVVEPHTPSVSDLDFLLPPEMTEPPNVTQEVNVEAAYIQNHFASTFTGPGEVEYTHGELLLIDGKEYYLYPGSGSGKLQLLDKDGILYDFDGTNPPESTGTKRADFPEKDEYISINGAVYQVLYSEKDKVVLYMDGKIVGEYLNYGALLLYGDDYHPDKVNERQQLSGTVTSGESPIDGLVSGKTYNVSVIGSNDISVPGYDEALLNSIKTETEAEKAAKAEVERLKADMEVKKAVVDQLDANDPDHMAAWAAWDEAEIAYEEALAELAALTNLQSATVTQKFQIPDALVGRNDVKFVAVHVTNPHATALAAAKFKMEEARWVYWEYHGDSYEERQRLHMAAERAAFEWAVVQELYDEWEKEHAADTGTGNDLGTVTIAEDGKTLTATYTVSSFSPFTVYAFTEAELPEIKEFVTQPDGTLVRVVNGQPVTTHTVASGENLTVIARKYGCTVDEIVALNSDLIENPRLIFAGWVLTIPAE